MHHSLLLSYWLRNFVLQILNFLALFVSLIWGLAVLLITYMGVCTVIPNLKKNETNLADMQCITSSYQVFSCGISGSIEMLLSSRLGNLMLNILHPSFTAHSKNCSDQNSGITLTNQVKKGQGVLLNQWV